jgi:hypothetical protein
MKTNWFFSEAHMPGDEVPKTKKRRPRMPVKVYKGEELVALATSMGYTVNQKAQQKDIEVSALPAALKKFIK